MSFSPPEVSSSMADISPTPPIINQSPHDTMNTIDDTTANLSRDDTVGATEDDTQFQVKKRQKTSKVWLEFQEVDTSDGPKVMCNHCKSKLSILKSKSTSHLSRHLAGCIKRKNYQKQQKLISFQATDVESQQTIAPALIDGKFDMSKMREAMA